MIAMVIAMVVGMSLSFRCWCNFDLAATLSMLRRSSDASAFMMEPMESTLTTYSVEPRKPWRCCCSVDDASHEVVVQGPPTLPFVGMRLVWVPERAEASTPVRVESPWMSRREASFRSDTTGTLDDPPPEELEEGGRVWGDGGRPAGFSALKPWSLASVFVALRRFLTYNVLNNSSMLCGAKRCKVSVLPHDVARAMHILLLLMDVCVTFVTAMELWCNPSAVSDSCDPGYFVMFLLMLPFAAIGAPILAIVSIANQSSVNLRRVSAAPCVYAPVYSLQCPQRLVF